jgi:hypothetical protein
MGKKILRHIAFLATGLAVTVVQAAVPPTLPSCKDVVNTCNNIGAPPANKVGCWVYKANAEALGTCEASYAQDGGSGDFDYCWATCVISQKNHINSIPNVCQASVVHIGI